MNPTEDADLDLLANTEGLDWETIAERVSITHTTSSPFTYSTSRSQNAQTSLAYLEKWRYAGLLSAIPSTTTRIGLRRKKRDLRSSFSERGRKPPLQQQAYKKHT